MRFFGQGFQCRRGHFAFVQKYVQGYFYAQIIEAADFVIDIGGSPVIWGVGKVKGDDMNVGNLHGILLAHG
jgi:hypothetical protein